MNEEIIIIEEELIESQTAVSPSQTSRRIFMAGIGVVITLKGEVAALANQIIEQSQQADSGNFAGSDNVGRKLKKPVAKFLNRLNIPTKRDIDLLNNQILTLIEKVETLAERQTALPAAASTEIPSISENEADSHSE